MSNIYNILSGITSCLSGIYQPIKKSLDYNQHLNKPLINNVQLSGNVTGQQLGLLTRQDVFNLANNADIQFDPTQVFTISANTELRNISNQPAVFVYNAEGIDVTSLATIKWKNSVLTVDTTQLSTLNIPLTGIWKIKFAGTTLYLNTKQNNLKILDNLSSVIFTPQNNKVYKYEIQGNEQFVFTTPINTNEIINFRLYLIMPSSVVSVSFPSNIIWEDIPILTNVNSLYMFCFQWNPILNKWLGNQMWQSVLIQE